MPSTVTRNYHHPGLVQHVQLAQQNEVAPPASPTIQMPNPFETVANHYDRTNGVRRVIGFVKSLGKARNTKPFMAIGTGVQEFMEKFPVVGKVLMVAQIFSFLGMIAQLPKLARQVKRIVVCEGIKKVNAGMKSLVSVGKIIRCFAYMVVGLQAFQVGQKLAAAGLTTLAKVNDATAGVLSKLFIASFFLTAAQTFVDGRSWWKTRQFVANLKKQDWYKADGRYTEKDYQKFKAYVKEMSPKEEKTLGRHLGVKGAVLRKNLLEKMRNAVPTGNNLTQMAKDIQSIIGKLETGKKVHVVSVITGLIGLGGTICLLIPPLQPLAVVCVSAAGLATLAKMIFNSINRYRFENKMGTIDRPEGVKAPKDWKEHVVDYTKWQVGWYNKTSLFQRIRNAVTNIGEAFVELVTPLTDTVDAIVAVANVI